MTQTERNSKCVLPLPVAVYRATKDKRGVVGEICETYGMNYNTVSAQLNPNNDSHTLSPELIEYVAEHTQDIRIAQSICARMGMGCYVIPECDGSDPIIMKALAESIEADNQKVQAIMQSMADGVITPDEYSKIQKTILESQGKQQKMLVMLEHKMNSEK